MRSLVLEQGGVTDGRGRHGGSKVRRAAAPSGGQRATSAARGTQRSAGLTFDVYSAHLVVLRESGRPVAESTEAAVYGEPQASNVDARVA